MILKQHVILKINVLLKLRVFILLCFSVFVIPCPSLYAESTIDCSNKSNAKECNNRVVEILHNWEGKDKLNPADARLISSFLKTNIDQYIKDEQALNEINDDLEQGKNNPDLETVDLHKLDNDNIFITIPIFMAAYQGQSLSFLFNKTNKELRIVRFQKYDTTDKKLTTTYEHSNYADWFDSMFMIHERSQGYLYECGSTEYYKFEFGEFKLIKQTQANCNEKELDSISKNKMTPEEIKIITVYPHK